MNKIIGLILFALVVSGCGKSREELASDRAEQIMLQLQKTGHLRQMQSQEFLSIREWLAAEILRPL